MVFALLKPSRTVLLVSDEALYVYAVSPGGARLVETVPWEAEGFVANVARILARECNGKPALILNDMVEQHYRKERVLKAGVGALDRANMIKRKLNVAYPNYPVKAALPLKEKPPKTDKRGASDIYIFAALPNASQIVKTIEAARESYVSIAGLCLLPVESSDMVHTLSNKLSKARANKAKWAIFIGQHKNGSLRQIVTKNGELALTRMTPVSDNISNAKSWAEDVHQEFKATMSYLSRFGYQAEDGLDIILVSDSSLGEVLGGLIEEESNFSALTPHDAAQLLNLPLGKQDDTHHADPLHAAWAGRKSRFLLPLRSPQLEQVSKPRKRAMAASFILIATAAFFAYQFFGQVKNLAGLNSQINQAQKQRAQLDVSYQKEVQRKESLGFDVRLVQSSLAVYTTLEENEIKVLPLFKAVGSAMGRDLRLDMVDVRRPGKKGLGTFVPQMSNDTEFEVLLQMTYPGTTDIDKGNKEVSDLRDRLRVLLPQHKIQVTKFLKDYEYVEELVVESGDLAKEDVQQDYIAEIKITGVVRPEGGAP